MERDKAVKKKSYCNRCVNYQCSWRSKVGSPSFNGGDVSFTQHCYIRAKKFSPSKVRQECESLNNSPPVERFE